jgi:nascent polypeptide-associated complex subunit alpha
MMPGGMDPKKMQQMMKQMGINSEEVDAKSVIIETDEGKLIVENPQVVKITMQGQVSFQISGNVRKESAISDEDVKMVADQAGVSEEEAMGALKDSGGDIAEAIMKLKEKEP